MEKDKDDLIRDLDRRLKLRALHAFEQVPVSQREIEREFAAFALEMMRRQPAMAELAGLRCPAFREVDTEWTAPVEQPMLRAVSQRH